MKSATVLAVALAAALGLGACHPHDDSDFGARVKAYLMAHPEALRAALDNMQTKEEADQAKTQEHDEANAQAALPALRAALERDPRDFVANPAGKISVTEFYDYRCPHCINIAPKVVALIHSHPDVRFVFKEMPIFGDTSEHAARAALAAKAQGKDYVGLYDAFMSTHPLTDQEIDRIAASKGVDIAAMNAPAVLAKDKVQMADTANLAKELAIDGTPGFVIGDTFVRGEDDDGLAAAIAAAEHKG
jgi:protein-disulfide isomerase